MKAIAVLAFGILFAFAPAGRGEEELPSGPCVDGLVCKTTTSPRLLKQVHPKPVRGRTGQVILALIVSAHGRVEGVRLLHGVHPDADQAAMSAALRWRFTPGTCDGTPVPMYFTATITFPTRPPAGA